MTVTQARTRSPFSRWFRRARGRGHPGSDQAEREAPDRPSRRRAPFSYVDQAGKVTGYSIALCEKVVDAVKTRARRRRARRRVREGRHRGPLRRGRVREGRSALRRGRRSRSRRRQAGLLLDADLPERDLGGGSRGRARAAAWRCSTVASRRTSRAGARTWRRCSSACALGRGRDDRRCVAGPSGASSSRSTRRSSRCRATRRGSERVRQRDVRRLLRRPRDPARRGRAQRDGGQAGRARLPVHLRADRARARARRRGLPAARGSHLGPRTARVRSARIYTQYFGAPDENTRSFFRFVALPE